MREEEEGDGEGGSYWHCTQLTPVPWSSALEYSSMDPAFISTGTSSLGRTTRPWSQSCEGPARPAARPEKPTAKTTFEHSRETTAGRSAAQRHRQS